MTVIGAADARSDSHRNKQIFDVGTLRVGLSASAILDIGKGGKGA